MTQNTDFIEIIDNALSADLCAQIIDIFEKSKNLAPGHTGGGLETDKKRSIDISITQSQEFSPIFEQVMRATGRELCAYFKQYYFALIGPIGLTIKHPQTGEPTKLNAENFEEVLEDNFSHMVNYLFRIGDINAQRYTAGEGGYPYWHSEIYPQKGSIDALHRNLLFMFYLNDVEEGGETEFFYQNRKVKPQTGRMVIAPAGFTHTHRGNMPTSNDKYILTSWVLFNSGDDIYR